jgi:CDP-diacylglycerol---serine O-phosphatidyltransferase
MNFRVIIPNFLTCLNLCCGFAGIIFAFNENLEYSAIFIGIAAVFDFLDGLAARTLNGGSELGKQLDSLADAVSFGILPGIIMFQLISIGLGDYEVQLHERTTKHLLISLSAFLIPVFSALRLAKFNIDDRQADYFIGLPTPANALFIASFPLILGVQYNINFYYPSDTAISYLFERHFFSVLDIKIIHLLLNPIAMAGLAGFLSLLLVSGIRLMSLKFKGIRFQRNKIRYVFLAVSVALGSTVYYTELYF